MYLDLFPTIILKLSVKNHVLRTGTFNFSDTDVIKGTPFRIIWCSHFTTLFVNEIVRKNSHLSRYDADQKYK